jgi:hypothetical protein
LIIFLYHFSDRVYFLCIKIYKSLYKYKIICIYRKMYINNMFILDFYCITHQIHCMENRIQYQYIQPVRIE